MSDTKKVVVNRCYGGFSVSPEAALWMWEHGWKELATPVDEYFGDNHDDKAKALKKWRAYLAGDKKRPSLFVIPFTPDETAVLNDRPDNREHPPLVECVETMGAAANGPCAKLEVVEIPADVDYEIAEYDGLEHVAEKHRTW